MTARARASAAAALLAAGSALFAAGSGQGASPAGIRCVTFAPHVYLGLFAEVAPAPRTEGTCVVWKAGGGVYVLQHATGRWTRAFVGPDGVPCRLGKGDDLVKACRVG